MLGSVTHNRNVCGKCYLNRGWKPLPQGCAQVAQERCGSGFPAAIALERLNRASRAAGIKKTRRPLCRWPFRHWHPKQSVSSQTHGKRQSERHRSAARNGNWNISTGSEDKKDKRRTQTHPPSAPREMNGGWHGSWTMWAQTHIRDVAGPVRTLTAWPPPVKKPAGLWCMPAQC